MIYYCADCNIELTGKNKPIRCGSCATVKCHEDGVYSRKEVLEKKSISMRKVCSDPEYRAEMSLNRRIDWARGVYDDTFDEAHRKAMSIAMKAAWERGDLYKLPPMPRRISNLEIDVCGVLEDNGFVCVTQYKIPGKRYTYDIYLPEHNTIIEVDGEYWHYSENAVAVGQPERDALKTDWANENDYDIIRVRERDLNTFGLEEYVECELIPVLSEFINENVS